MMLGEKQQAGLLEDCSKPRWPEAVEREKMSSPA